MIIVEDGTKRSVLQEFVNNNIRNGFSILSNSKDSFIVINLLGEIEYASPTSEDLLGYSTNHLQRMRLKDLFHNAILNKKQTFFEGKSKGKLVNFETLVTAKGEKKIPVMVSSMPIYKEDDIIGFYFILEPSINDKQDTSVIDQLAQLSEKRATAGHLAAGIAHEIRNPITAIKGFLQLLQDQKEGNQVYFNVITSEIERIELILKELMVLAKPNKQKYERVDLQKLLDQVLTFMQPQALLNNIQIQKEYDFDHCCLLGDENQLKQVFINYIKNAIESMSNGGRVFIQGMVLLDGRLRVSIVDEGSGIPNDLLNRVGEIFFTTKENGTGLGMLVSEQIVKEHKGNIHIKSNSNGTSITIDFKIE